MTAWVLPDHIADVLPTDARRIEETRRLLLDAARSYGYELVIPPLVEHLGSLLSGQGQALNLQTFKLVDQLSGRSLGVRADTTPQVARIDAHLLNRQGVARLAYCGPVLHTRPDKPHATREPLQFGCELYGHAGMEAELEVLQLALDALHAAGVDDLTLDLSDARLLPIVLKPHDVAAHRATDIAAALADKDAGRLLELTADLQANLQKDLQTLLGLFGDASVLLDARNSLSPAKNGLSLLSNLEQLAAALQAANPKLRIQFDLADARGYGYYSGLRFAVYAPKAAGAVLRGGRYDEVGQAFGRKRAAVGFSLDVKELVATLPASSAQAAIRAPWVPDDVALTQAIARLRRGGETVVCMLPGHESEVEEFHCDRELVDAGGVWTVKSV
jgi:ATP phosphoribosyltransferase regulatory subunit